MTKFTLPKEERLHSKNHIERLIKDGKSIVVYPFRVVFIVSDDAETISSRVAISVSKKRFKKAVHRNRIKRLIKEAYRINKEITICNKTCLDILLIYLDNELPTFDKINKSLIKLLKKISSVEKLSK